MRVRIEFTGTTPLMMHSDQLADSSNKFTIMIKELTAKGTNKTEKDEQEISKLEWYGSAYRDDKNEIVIPSANIIRCLRSAASITKKGTAVARAMSPRDLLIPLSIGEGKSRNLDKLWANPIHTDRRMVGVSKSRVRRTRPIFPVWGLVTDFELLESVMDLTMLEGICDLAGTSTGLGDARILGFGRFTCKIEKAALKKTA